MLNDLAPVPSLAVSVSDDADVSGHGTSRSPRRSDPRQAASVHPEIIQAADEHHSARDLTAFRAPRLGDA